MRGLVISQGIAGVDLQADERLETPDDLLRRVPDQWVIIEFVHESPIADRAGQCCASPSLRLACFGGRLVACCLILARADLKWHPPAPPV
jgi:hypothetical protein